MTEKPEPEPTEERWIYAGLRVLNDKRAHSWITDEATGERRVWVLTGTFVVGGYYTARATRDTDGKLILYGVPTYTGTQVDTETRRVLFAEDHAARTKLARIAMERKHLKENPLDEMLRPLMRVAAKLSTRAERDAFAMYVMNELHRAMYVHPDELK